MVTARAVVIRWTICFWGIIGMTKIRSVTRSQHRVWLLASAAALPLLAIMPAQAQEMAAQAAQTSPEDGTHNFDVKSQPLADALIAFSQQAGIEVFFGADALEGIASPGVTGQHSVETGLRVLLAGTGMDFRFSNPTTVTIHALPSGSMILAPLTVIAESDRGYNSSSVMSATNTLAESRDIPRSIEVINRDIIEDTNAQTVGEALQYVAGTSLTSSASLNGFGDDFLIRGFSSAQNFATNNVLATRVNHPRDTINVERIEVLKGPASLLYGEQQPGAVVNVVTKQPQDEFHASAAAEGGSYDFWRLTGDVGGPVSENGALKFRLTGAYDERDSYIDDWEKDHQFISGVMSLDVTDDTLLTLETTYSKDDWNSFYNGVPAAGLVFKSDNGKYDRDINISEPDYDGTERYAISSAARLEHAFNDNLVLRANFMWLQNDYTQEEVLPIALLADERTLRRAAFGADSRDNNYIGQINLNAQADTGPFSHDILVGADYRHQDSSVRSGGVLIDNFDLYNPSYTETDFPDLNLPHTTQDLDTWGIYAQDRIGITEEFQLVGGVRYSKSKLDSERRQNGVSTFAARNDDAWTTDIGIVYQPIEEVALYASRSDSFNPQTGTNADGQAFEPEEAEQYEIGAKVDWLDGALSTDLAFFHITLENALTADPDNPGEVLSIGEQESRGLEFTVRGEILPGWNALVAYGLTDTEVTKTNDGFEGKRFRNVPTHTLSFATRYDFQDEILEGLSLTGAVRFMSDRSIDNEDTMSLPAQARLDLGVIYNPFESVEFNARVENVTDAKIYDASDSDVAVYPGAPRTFLIGGRITY